MTALWISVVAVTYFGAAQVGLQMALVRGQVTPVWPRPGLALAALLVLGLRIWPGLAIGEFAASIAHIYFSNGRDFPTGSTDCATRWPYSRTR
ncbi:hypothetical protein CRH09_27225 [Nocardia terpenica]|uniref:MASE1 domain-containing protein n=1 Tax=Nocardia terpenica TaxID=455432 RepID=A0A291RPS8_9NOCA|nr:hypothetical protein CRH09_27225 [Nocardia terpenica]